jgi:CheY-like chemotaxis protein
MVYRSSRPSYTCLLFAHEPIRVLLIEPNERDRHFITQTLGDLNYQVLALSDRTQAQEAIVQFRPHVLLLDTHASQFRETTLLPDLQQQYTWAYIPAEITAVLSFVR